MQKVKIIPNIDTICVLLDIENYEENAKDIIEYLLKEKEKTKEEQLTSPDYSNILDIGNMKFEILPIGKRGYSILLKNVLTKEVRKNLSGYSLLITSSIYASGLLI